MRNLTMREWAGAFLALVAMTVLSASLDIWALWFITQIGWILLVAERGHNLGRSQADRRLVKALQTHVQLCNQNPLGDAQHGCVRRADDGHTMHLCAHGDCSWGY